MVLHCQKSRWNADRYDHRKLSRNQTVDSLQVHRASAEPIRGSRFCRSVAGERDSSRVEFARRKDGFQSALSFLYSRPSGSRARFSSDERGRESDAEGEPEPAREHDDHDSGGPALAQGWIVKLI